MNTSGIGASSGRRTLGPRRPAVGRGTTLGAKPSARRCLFGPVDHKETDDFLKEMNRQFDEQKKELWGFDFKAGFPVPGGHPMYEWVAVGPNDDIPCAYGRMAESWRDPEVVSWASENTLLGGPGVSTNSYRLNDRSRKRPRRLSPCSPDLDTANCPNAEDGPLGLEGASRPRDEPALKDLRKSEKLEKHSGLKLSHVPERLEGPDLSSDVPERLEGPGLSSDLPERLEGPGLSSDAPERVEGPGLSSDAPERVEGPGAASVAGSPEDRPTSTDDLVVVLPDPCCNVKK